MSNLGRLQGPLVVLDDDPTGTQNVTGVPVVLEATPELIAEAASSGARGLYVLTNSRAHRPERAYALVRDAVSAAVAALGLPRFVLRGDSTLRGHVLEEYRGLCDVVFPRRTPPLLLVPSLPHQLAGRVTLGGIHLIERGGQRIPLHETEYAADPTFAYRDARLLQWAEDRSKGFFDRKAGREVPLEQLRTEGPDAVSATLAELESTGKPAVCAPDVMTLADLELVAAGLRNAEAEGVDVVVRCAPAFAGVIAGTLATENIMTPRAPNGLLVVCGSYVPTTSLQLSALTRAHPSSFVEVDVIALASASPGQEIERVARAAGERLRVGRLAVISTPRERPEELRSLKAGERIAINLARVLRALRPLPEVVLAKGGITSALTARVGLDARIAYVLGPLIDGVAMWSVPRLDGTSTSLVVFPGNVGDEGTLVDLCDRILGA